MLPLMSYVLLSLRRQSSSLVDGTPRRRRHEGTEEWVWQILTDRIADRVQCEVFVVFMMGDSVAVLSAAAITGRLRSGCEACHSQQLQSRSVLIQICIHEGGGEGGCERPSMSAFHYAYESVCVCVTGWKPPLLCGRKSGPAQERP